MQQFTFKQIDADSYAAAYYEGDMKKVFIPKTYDGKPVTMLFDRLFAEHDEIESVRIPDTVQHIASCVFDGCSNLRHVELPDSITDIWTFGFLRSGIQEITLPPGLKRIMPFAFQDCKNLKIVYCNEALEEICAGAFSGCDALETIDYGPDVKVSPEAFTARQEEFKVEY